MQIAECRFDYQYQRDSQSEICNLLSEIAHAVTSHFSLLTASIACINLAISRSLQKIGFQGKLRARNPTWPPFFVTTETMFALSRNASNGTHRPG